MTVQLSPKDCLIVHDLSIYYHGEFTPPNMFTLYGHGSALATSSTPLYIYPSKENIVYNLYII